MKRLGALAVVLSLGCCVAAGCQGATQVLLDVRTSVDCSDPARWRGVAVYVGAPGLDVESRAPSLTTSECHPAGEIGTLVITPNGGKDDEIGIRVVAGITTNPEDCAAKNYAGCIVARRSTRFRHHESTSLVVALEAACIGNACDSARTCLNGVCVDARESSVQQLSTDPDAATTADDATTSGGAMVRCGDNRVTCPANDPNNVCCITVSADGKSTLGKCGRAGDCLLSQLTLYCDENKDCANVPGNDAGPAVCCLSNQVGICQFGPKGTSGSECVPDDRCQGTGLCEDRAPCLTGAICGAADTSALLPGYFTCCQ